MFPLSPGDSSLSQVETRGRAVSCAFSAIGVRAGLALGAVVVGVAAGSIPASGAAGGTVRHRFSGFSGSSLASGLLVRERVAGSCWTTSAVVGRAYSWRCLHGNEIHDPCFSATRHSSIVVCPVRPWSRTVLVIRLTSALPGWKEYGFDQNFPSVAGWHSTKAVVVGITDAWT
jgi:hypothetical protein